jgi:site-specific DNA recombinase
MDVALYARVSTSKQADMGLSIPDQLRQLRDWCKSLGHRVVGEYVEEGASATDDHRPEFQKMIGDASLCPPPFKAIAVHSLSRFFRDAFEFELYARKLNRSGIKVISITQQTGDDPSGEMARKMFSLFDEYQSKENAKHTLRAMKENARQGFWNGARPPFGYRIIDADLTGKHGKPKRCLDIDSAEAASVRRIYQLYLSGLRGRSMGMKNIASHLNSQGITMRGQPWRIQKINQILSNRIYVGEGHFNQTEYRTRRQKPANEWIKFEVASIVDEITFDKVAARRHARQPRKIPAQRLASNALLIGIIKCGHCGSSMTQASGKSGRYRYYKCTTRISKGATQCTSRNLSKDIIEKKVLSILADKVFTPNRVAIMLRELSKRLRASRTVENARLLELTRELGKVDEGSRRLYEAVEKGLIPLDSSLQERSHKLQARRHEILIERASIKDAGEIPLKSLTSTHTAAFTRALRTRLLDTGSEFGKAYLNLLVDEIRLDGNELRIKGSFQALARVFTQANGRKLGEVPSSIPDWRPHGDSNPGYRRERVIS